MHYVYIIKSKFNPNKKYTGQTLNLKQRLKSHNQGKSKYTSAYKPWKLIYYCAFEETSKAIKFESYLKSGSGKAFANKHLI